MCIEEARRAEKLNRCQPGIYTGKESTPADPEEVQRCPMDSLRGHLENQPDMEEVSIGRSFCK